METQTGTGGDREYASTGSTNKKEPTGSLCVPLTDINTLESISLGFRDHLFDVCDDDGAIIGSMTCTSIGGGDALIMQWGDGNDRKQAFIRGRDIFAAWLKQFDPEAAESLPGVRYV